MDALKKYAALCCLTALCTLLTWTSASAQLATYGNADLLPGTSNIVSIPAINTAIQEVEVDARWLKLTLDLGEVYPLGNQEWDVELDLKVHINDQANSLIQTLPLSLHTYDFNQLPGEP